MSASPLVDSVDAGVFFIVCVGAPRSPNRMLKAWPVPSRHRLVKSEQDETQARSAVAITRPAR